MAFNTDPAALVNMGGALLMTALGVFVATIRHGGAENRAFAVFAVAFGGRFVAYNVVTPDDPNAALYQWVATALTLTAATALVAVARTFPAPLEPKRRGLQVVPAVVAVIYAGASTLVLVLARQPEIGFPSGTYGTAFLLQVVAMFVLVGAHLFSLVLLALRFRAAEPGEAHLRRQYALLSAALAIYPGFVAGAGFSGRQTSILSDLIQVRWWAALVPLAMLGVALTWLLVAGTTAEPRAARNLAWLCLGMPLLGLVYVALFPGQQAFGGPGLARAAAVVVFAYAILKHQLFAIDLKLKWTLKHSTIGAAFIAVFFVFSEGAQQLFSETAGPYVGFLAAGLLAFGLAPLQRAADRIANVAMPHVQPTDAYVGARKADVYRATLRSLLADRFLSRSDERTLAHLAEELGITAGAAYDLRVEIEQELGLEPRDATPREPARPARPRRA